MAIGQKSILIVDDEMAVRRPLRKKLSWTGYLCEEASSGEEALEKLKGNTFDLLILDLKMPGKSGFELFREIRTSYPQIPVIIATAVSTPNVAIQLMDEGAQDFIAKPFKLSEVVLSVYRVLDKGLKHFPEKSRSLWWRREIGTCTSILTARQSQVLNLIAQGYENKQIANTLGISDQTVKNHVTSILEKLQVNHRTGAVLMAVRQGLIPLNMPTQTRQELLMPES